MPSAQAPNPVDTSGIGLERNGPGAPGAAERAASHAASWSGCQSTVMAPPSDGPLAEWAVPKLPSTPSCSPLSRLSSAPKYTFAPWASAAIVPSGVPDCGVTLITGGPPEGGESNVPERPGPLPSALVLILNPPLCTFSFCAVWSVHTCA